jgi:hypothetical protein
MIDGDKGGLYLFDRELFTMQKTKKTTPNP